MADQRKTTEITFDAPKGHAGSVKVEGLDLTQSPEKIQKLLELLELPEGTIATVTLHIASEVVR